MPACRYFDGASTRPWPATATADGDALRVVGDGLDRRYARDALRFAPATSGGPARIAFAGGGLCEFVDGGAASALFAALGYRGTAADRLSSRTSYAIGFALLFVVVMAGAYRWGVPWVSDEVVDRLPRRWDQTIGERVLATLDERHVLQPTRLDDARRDDIVAKFDALDTRLQRRLGPRDAPTLVFRRFGAPNALALPGDLIVVTDEIVALSPDDDALMTVLAHELGHVEQRDAMRQLVRGTLSSALAAWYLGDVSTAAAAVAGGLGTLSYSRDAEHRADLYAVDAMHAARRSTRSAATLFRRLEQWRPAPAKDAKPERTSPRFALPVYLSTHPATEERIRLFEDADDASSPH